MILALIPPTDSVQTVNGLLIYSSCLKKRILHDEYDPEKGRGPLGERPRGGLAALRGTLRPPK